MCRSRFRTSALATLLLLLEFTSPGAKPDRHSTAVKKGHTSPDEAIAGCAAAIRSGRLQGPVACPAYNYTGNALLAKGDIDGGIANLDRAIPLDPESRRSSTAIAPMPGTRKGQYDRAIADADTALRLDAKIHSCLRQSRQCLG